MIHLLNFLTILHNIGRSWRCTLAPKWNPGKLVAFVKWNGIHHSWSSESSVILVRGTAFNVGDMTSTPTKHAVCQNGPHHKIRATPKSRCVRMPNRLSMRCCRVSPIHVLKERESTTGYGWDDFRKLSLCPTIYHSELPKDVRLD